MTGQCSLDMGSRIHFLSELKHVIKVFKHPHLIPLCKHKPCCPVTHKKQSQLLDVKMIRDSLGFTVWSVTLILGPFCDLLSAKPGSNWATVSLYLRALHFFQTNLNQTVTEVPVLHSIWIHNGGSKRPTWQSHIKNKKSDNSSYYFQWKFKTQTFSNKGT